MIKVLFLFLVLGHSAVAFYIASSDIHHFQISEKFSFFSTFFRQSWSFFGPYPVLSNTIGEFRCIYSDKVAGWSNIANKLEESKKPYSSIFISNNNDYLLEGLMEKAIYSVPEEAYKMCDLGDCSVLSSSFENTFSYKKMQSIVRKLCRAESPKDSETLLGSKVRITIKNVPYYSQRTSTKERFIDDVLELPYFEI